MLIAPCTLVLVVCTGSHWIRVATVDDDPGDDPVVAPQYA